MHLHGSFRAWCRPSPVVPVGCPVSAPMHLAPLATLVDITGDTTPRPTARPAPDLKALTVCCGDDRPRLRPHHGSGAPDAAAAEGLGGEVGHGGEGVANVGGLGGGGPLTGGQREYGKRGHGAVANLVPEERVGELR